MEDMEKLLDFWKRRYTAEMMVVASGVMVLGFFAYRTWRELERMRVTLVEFRQAGKGG